MKRNHKYLGLAILLIATASITVGSCVTYAAYTAAQEISQSTGYLGKFDQDTIFLNANIWEVDDPVFYMYRWSSSHTGNDTGIYVSPSKVITPTIGGVNFKLYVFEYDKSAKDACGSHTCDSFLFYRLNRVLGGNGFATTASTSYRIHNYTTDTYIDLFADERDSNHYVARHVTFTASDRIEVETIGDSIEYYGNGNPKQDVYPGAGTWTIDFYISVDNDNHIYCTNENHLYNFRWDQTGDFTYTSSNNYYCITGWGSNHVSTNSTSHLALDSDENLYFG